MSFDINSLRANSILMEQLEDIKFSQVGRDRLHYDDIVLEAIGTQEGQAVLLDKLYKDTQKIEGIDFGSIPDTRGDITKFRYYGQLNDCIELINQIVADNLTPNIQTMNRLQQILLDARSDFEFGFKTENYVITSMYKVMVLALFEIENVCIVDMTNYLRQKLSINMNARKASEIRTVVKSANQFIKMYENGQWSTMVKTFRSGKALEFAIEHDDVMTPATEFDLNISVNNANDMLTTLRRIVKGGTTPSGENVSGGISTVRGAIDAAADKAKNAPMPKGLKIAGAVVGCIIGALIIIRVMVKLFYRGAGNLKQWIKTNADILKTHLSLQQDKNDAVTKQKKLLDKLENTADVIEYNVLKSEREAASDITKSDRENFGPADFKNINGSDFEF